MGPTKDYDCTEVKQHARDLAGDVILEVRLGHLELFSTQPRTHARGL